MSAEPWLIAVGAIFLGQLVKGAVGFGSALIGMPLLAAALPPPTALLLVVTADLLAGAGLAWQARGAVNRGVVLNLLLPLLVGQWYGTTLLTELPVATVRALIAAVVGAYGLTLLWRPVPGGAEQPSAPPDPRHRAAEAVTAGAIAGVFSGLAGVPGPVLHGFLGRHFDRDGIRAHLLVVLLPTSLVLTLTLTARGAVGAEAWSLVPLTLPAAALGGWCGTRIAGKTSPERTGRAVGLLLISSAAALGSR